MLRSLCQGLAELASPQQDRLQDTAAPGSSSPGSACLQSLMALYPHQDPTGDPLGPGHQQGHPTTAAAVAATAPYTLLHVFQPCRLHSFMSCAQPLMGTGYLVTTNQTQLEFGQMTLKKISTAANTVATTPNPDFDTITSPLPSPCIPGCPGSEHTVSRSVSVLAAQAAGNPLCHGGADSAHGAICQHTVHFPFWVSPCTWGEQPGSMQFVNSLTTTPSERLVKVLAAPRVSMPGLELTLLHFWMFFPLF